MHWCYRPIHTHGVCVRCRKAIWLSSYIICSGLCTGQTDFEQEEHIFATLLSSPRRQIASTFLNCVKLVTNEWQTASSVGLHCLPDWTLQFWNRRS